MIKECAEELTMAEDFIQYLYKLSGKSNDEFIRKTADKLLEKLKSEIEGVKK